MKTSIHVPSILVPGLFVFLTASACAQEAHPEFSDVDTNSDGVLSIPEAQSALPDIEIADVNGDGLLNQVEAESAIPGLVFSANGYAGGSALITEAEYRVVLATLDLNRNSDS